MTKPCNVTKALYTSIVGFSPLAAGELAYRAGIDGAASVDALDDVSRDNLYQSLVGLITDIQNERYTPLIVFDGYTPIEFSSVKLTMYQDKELQFKEDISSVLDEYFSKRSTVTRIRQKSADLRKIGRYCDRENK